MWGQGKPVDFCNIIKVFYLSRITINLQSFTCLRLFPSVENMSLRCVGVNDPTDRYSKAKVCIHLYFIFGEPVQIFLKAEESLRRLFTSLEIVNGGAVPFLRLTELSVSWAIRFWSQCKSYLLRLLDAVKNKMSAKCVARFNYEIKLTQSIIIRCGVYAITPVAVAGHKVNVQMGEIGLDKDISSENTEHGNQRGKLSKRNRNEDIHVRMRLN